MFTVRDAGHAVIDLEQLVKTHKVERVVLTGRYEDALGLGHEAGDELDLAEYSEAFYTSSLRVVPDDPIQRIAESVDRLSRQHPTA